MVEKCLVLSTAHIPNPYAENSLGQPDFGNVTVMDSEYGWAVYVGSPDVSPEWIKPVVRKALNENCALILFDRDADTYPDDFKVYDW